MSAGADAPVWPSTFTPGLPLTPDISGPGRHFALGPGQTFAKVSNAGSVRRGGLMGARRTVRAYRPRRTELTGSRRVIGNSASLKSSRPRVLEGFASTHLASAMAQAVSPIWRDHWYRRSSVGRARTSNHWVVRVSQCASLIQLCPLQRSGAEFLFGEGDALRLTKAGYATLTCRSKHGRSS
jgi:hypothetical protein